MQQVVCAIRLQALQTRDETRRIMQHQKMPTLVEQPRCWGCRSRARSFSFSNPRSALYVARACVWPLLPALESTRSTRLCLANTASKFTVVRRPPSSTYSVEVCEASARAVLRRRGSDAAQLAHGGPEAQPSGQSFSAAWRQGRRPGTQTAAEARRPRGRRAGGGRDARASTQPARPPR